MEDNEIPFPIPYVKGINNPKDKLTRFMEMRNMDQLYEIENGRFNVANGFTNVPKFVTVARIESVEWNHDQTALEMEIHGNPGERLPMQMPTAKVIEAAKFCVGKYLVRFWLAPAGGLPKAAIMSKEEVEFLCKGPKSNTVVKRKKILIEEEKA